MRLPGDWRFKTSFNMDWRFQDSGEITPTVPEIAKILDNGQIAKILDNGEIWKIYHYRIIEEKDGCVRFEKADGNKEQINVF